MTGNADYYRRSCPPWEFRGNQKNNNTRYQLANQVCIKARHRRTSQSFTPFIISCSRANAARSRRYASLSPSANSNGTRCMRDQIFSLCSSLENSSILISHPSPFWVSTSRNGPILSMIRYLMRHAAGSHRTPRSPLGTYHLTRFPSPKTETVRTCTLTHLLSRFPFPTR